MIQKTKQPNNLTLEIIVLKLSVKNYLLKIIY